MARSNLAQIQNSPIASLPNIPPVGAQYQKPGALSSKQKAKALYPEAKFPRARAWWEGVKEGGGKVLSPFVGSPDAIEQVPTVTPEQKSVLEYLQQLGIQGLQNPYGGFAPIAQQSINQFNQETVPTLAERFTSMGNGALSSPAFASQLGQAGAGLHQDLAAQQAQYGQQNIQTLLQMLQLGLNPQSENIFRPGQNGLIQNAILAAIRGLGK